MASGTRHLIVAAFLLFYVYSVLGTESQRYCDGDFHHQVYWTCAGKRSGSSPYGLHDVLAVKRLRGLNFKRSAGTGMGDAAFLVSGLEKRAEYDGIASYCCLQGCTPDELSVVC